MPTTRLRRGARSLLPGLAVATALALAACGGGGGGGGGGAGATPAPAITGTVTAPGGRTGVTSFLRRAGEALGVLTPRSVASLDAAAGVPVALITIDDSGAFVSTVATTTTSSAGVYSFPVPTGFAPGLRYMVVAGTGANALRAFATGMTVDVNPYTEVAYLLVSQQVQAAGTTLGQVAPDQVVGLIETVQGLASSVDLTTSTAQVIADLEAVLQTGADTGNVVGNLTEPGGFVGTVTGPDGAPVADVLVRVHAFLEQTLEATARTDAAGRYAVHAPAGRYTVSVVNDRAGSTAASAWWTAAGGTALQSFAEPIDLGAAPVRRDFALSAGGRVAGTLTAEGTATPLAGIRVVVRKFEIGSVAAPTRTDASGRFLINVLPGTYYLEFQNDSLQPYASELYRAATNGANNRLRAEKITVQAGGSFTADASLLAGRRIYGFVLDPSLGTSVAGATVRVQDTATGGGITVAKTTDRNGFYGVWLRPEAYKLFAHGQIANVDLTASSQRTDFGANVGAISARLVNGAGAPLSGVTAYVYDASSGNNLGWEATKGDGSVTVFAPVVIATSVRLELKADTGIPYGTTMFDGKLSFPTGDTVAVPAVNAPRDLGTVAIPAGGVLTGTVRDATGAPRENMQVQVRHGGTSGTYRLTTVRTRSDGGYTIGLPAGTYDRIVAWDPATALGTTTSGSSWAVHDAVVVTTAAQVLDFAFTAAPAYGITGTVAGAIAAGVTVTLSGAASAVTTTASDGSYSFSNLANGTYTVTPSRFGVDFSPSSRSVTVAGKSVLGQGFTSSPKLYPITGTVSGAVAAGVTVTLSGSYGAVTTTNAQGFYSFLVNAGNYTVTPTLAGYTFSPPSLTFGITGSDGGKDFVASAVPVRHAISGAVSGAVQAGVTVTLSGDASFVTTTDGAGAYSFAGLADGNYTVTPSLAGYTFSPTSTAVALSGADATGRSFVASAIVNPHAISGTVSGAVAAGVTVTLSGSASAVTTTSAQGAYTFPGLADGSYTVTPSLAGYVFAPTSLQVTLSGADAPSRDFAASAAPPPAPPAAVAVFPGNGGALVAWTPSAGATGYRVYAGTTLPLAQASPVATPTGYTAVVGPFPNGQRVYLAVSAVGPGGESALAAPRCAVPTASSLTTSGAILELYDPLCDDWLAGSRWLANEAYAIEVLNGQLELYANAADLEARSVRNNTATGTVSVRAGGARVTTLASDITVPSGWTRSGGAVLRAAVRLSYQPPSTKLSSPNGNQDQITYEVGLAEAGGGLYAYRNVIHCDDATCAATSIANLDFSGDPGGLTTVTGFWKGAPAAYDATYRASVSLEEATGLFHWSITGPTLGQAGLSGTVDPSLYVSTTPSYATAPLGDMFNSAQLITRVHDASLAGGGSGAIGASFDDVDVGLNGAAAAPYDDFSVAPAIGPSGQLSLARWNVGTAVVEPDGGNVVISNGATSVGTAQSQFAGLNLGHPEQFDMFQADLTVPTYATTGGAASGYLGNPYLQGRFFNDGTVTGRPLGDATGDIYAGLSLLAGSGANGYIRRCGDATCSTTSTLVNGIAFPGFVTGSGTHQVRVGYSRALGAFEFAVDGIATTVPRPVAAPYGGPARAALKQVFTRVDVPAQAGAGTIMVTRVNNVSGRPDPSQGVGVHCNALDPAGAPAVAARYVPQAVPSAGATGGAIADGTYRASTFNTYTGVGGASGAAGFTVQQTFVFSGGVMDYAGLVAGGREQREGRFATAGQDLVVIATCPTSALKTFKYTVSGSTLTLYDGNNEMVLVRQ